MITERALNLFYENNIKGTLLENNISVQEDSLRISTYNIWNMFNIKDIDNLELSKTNTISSAMCNTNDEQYMYVSYSLTVTYGKSKLIFDFSNHVNMEDIEK